LKSPCPSAKDTAVYPRKPDASPFPAALALLHPNPSLWHTAQEDRHSCLSRKNVQGGLLCDRGETASMFAANHPALSCTKGGNNGNFSGTVHGPLSPVAGTLRVPSAGIVLEKHPNKETTLRLSAIRRTELGECLLLSRAQTVTARSAFAVPIMNYRKTLPQPVISRFDFQSLFPEKGLTPTTAFPTTTYRRPA
jgi:hypothetical protein